MTSRPRTPRGCRRSACSPAGSGPRSCGTWAPSASSRTSSSCWPRSTRPRSGTPERLGGRAARSVAHADIDGGRAAMGAWDMLHAVPHDRRVGKARGGARDGAAAAHPLLALQRSAGNAAVAWAILARRFDPDAWQKAIAERAQFMARRFEHDAWRPSTHRGNFGVLYEPMDARLTI